MKKFILTMVILGASLGVFAQKSKTILAKLADSVQCWDLLVNGEIIHTIKPGEIFYYSPIFGSACSANGQTGNIPFNKITKIDSLKYIRFEYRERDLEFKDYHEDLMLANSKGIHYKELVKKAINNDGKSLKEIMKIESYVDGAATELFADRFWKIIHFWSDENLSILLQNDTSGFKKSLSDFMMNEFYTRFSKEEIVEYLKLFFPETLKLLDIIGK